MYKAADAEGCSALAAVNSVLRNVITFGRAAGQYSEPFFIGAIPYPETFYVRGGDGSLAWWRLNPSKDKPDLTGPREVLRGLERFTTLVPGGGDIFYGLQSDGQLIWMRHEGMLDGSPRWAAERPVGIGWTFARLVPGHDGVIYAVTKDGDMLWYRHGGAEDGGGIETWKGPVALDRPILTAGSGRPWARKFGLPRRWTSFAHIVSPSRGLLYLVEPDGEVYWVRHDGHGPGTPAISGGQLVRNGWDNLAAVLGSGSRFYTLYPNGDLSYWTHAGSETGSDQGWTGPLPLGGAFGSAQQVFVPAFLPPLPIR